MASSAPAVTFPQAVFIGDSLTQFGFSEAGGWLSILADRAQRRCDMVQRGFSGYNTSWCRQLLPALYPDAASVASVALFTIFLGVNDANRPGTTGQHVAVPLFKENLEAMLEHLVGRCALARHRVLLVNVPPVDEVTFSAVLQRDGLVGGKHQEDCAEYVDAAQTVAEKWRVDCVDLQTAFLSRGDWQAQLLGDGLHFSKAGSQLVADLVWPQLEKRLSDCPVLFPLWKDLASSPNSVKVLDEWLQKHGGDTETNDQ